MPAKLNPLVQMTHKELVNHLASEASTGNEMNNEGAITVAKTEVLRRLGRRPLVRKPEGVNHFRTVADALEYLDGVNNDARIGVFTDDALDFLRAATGVM